MLRPDYWIAAAVPLAVQAALFVRWFHRRMRDDEIQRAFIRDLATNHLPHVYSALRQIAEAGGIALAEPPLLRYVEFRNGESFPARLGLSRAAVPHSGAGKRSR